MRALLGLSLGALLALGLAGLLLRDGGEGARGGERAERMPSGAPRDEPPPSPGPAPVGSTATRAAPAHHLDNEQGIAALEEGRLERAVALFERCRAAQPDEPSYAFNLAEALARLALEEYGRGEGERALERLGRARELAPAREDLRALHERWSAASAAEEELWGYESDHFELAFDAQRTDLLYGAQDVLDVLELGYHELALFFDARPVEDGRAKVRVVITDRAGFARATGLGEWAGGAYDGRIRIPVADLGRERAGLARVLRHELAHVFVHALAPGGAPGWLNEGLCQWLEPSGEGERELARASARGTLAGERLHPLAALRAPFVRWDDPDSVARLYAQAFLLVDAVARSYGDRELVVLLRGVARGEEPASVFRARTGVALEQVLADLAQRLGLEVASE